MEESDQKEEKGESIGKSPDFLESAEKELFETKLQLKAKVYNHCSSECMYEYNMIQLFVKA